MKRKNNRQQNRQLPQVRLNKHRNDRDDRHDKHRHEFAAEMTAPADLRSLDRAKDRTDGRAEAAVWMGWIALAAAVVSLFILPFVLGPAAAIVGFLAFSRGSRALGMWSITIGLVALFAHFILVPYYA